MDSFGDVLPSCLTDARARFALASDGLPLCDGVALLLADALASALAVVVVAAAVGSFSFLLFSSCLAIRVQESNTSRALLFTWSFIDSDCLSSSFFISLPYFRSTSWVMEKGMRFKRSRILSKRGLEESLKASVNHSERVLSSRVDFAIDT